MADHRVGSAKATHAEAAPMARVSDMNRRGLGVDKAFNGAMAKRHV
ncbi:MAG: hypothetical protein H0W36_01465 [Gemmatimonadetes bacterium]|jgi:hypothetical protein|nr:hypothetical protein [Gemmatimonadota bacterium]